MARAPRRADAAMARMGLGLIMLVGRRTQEENVVRVRAVICGTEGVLKNVDERSKRGRAPVSDI